MAFSGFEKEEGSGGGGREGARPWPQAEGLITVLAREQKAEGQEGWKGMGKGGGRRWRDFGP